MENLQEHTNSLKPLSGVWGLYMSRCLQLAWNGVGHVAPNPMVGAVLVCDDVIIGEGYHLRYGDAHAEPNAIDSVKNRDLLKQSTLYVSLEPCSHYGKTPPCADLIVKNNIPRVIIGTLDPNPKVAGRGVEILRKAGYVIVRTEDTDSRRKSITVSELGKSKIETAKPLWEEAQLKILQAVGAEEYKNFLGVLTVMQGKE